MTYSIDTLLDSATSTLSQVAQSLHLKPRFESELLLSFVLKVDRVYLHTHSTQSVNPTQAKHFLSLVEERAKGKPIEYITQSASFYEHTFYVNESVLIPRPESEILIQKGSKLITEQKIESIAEVGIGSGILSITLSLLHPQCRFFATDISQKALEVTQKNIHSLAPDSNITLKHCSLLPSSWQDIELIISNPPYICDDYPISLPLTYEPSIALFGGKDGLDILKALIVEAKNRKAFLLCEIGYDQKNALEQILTQHNAKDIEFYKDLSGLDRGFWCRF